MTMREATMREKMALEMAKAGIGRQSTWLELADAALSALETPDEGMVDEAIRWHAGPDADLATCFKRQWGAVFRSIREATP